MKRYYVIYRGYEKFPDNLSYEIVQANSKEEAYEMVDRINRTVLAVITEDRWNDGGY